MNANNIYKTITLLVILAGAALTPALALTITPAQKPLYIGSSKASPNIMLMIDNSLSMSITPGANVTTVAHTPNDMPAGTSYNCSSAVFGGAPDIASATTTINMVVDSSGVPRFCTNSFCSTSSAFSLLKCFDNTKYYKVKYFRGTSLASDVYLGLNLNWYFKSGSFTKGSLLWGATTRLRIDIAKEAAKTLVNSLVPDEGSSPTVRMGLATYKDPTGGQVLADIAPLTASYAEDLYAQITAMNTVGFTPLAETLADIGRYFSDGGGAYTGNLILHPGQSNQTSASLDTIYNTHSIFNNTLSGTLSVAVENYCQKNFAILVTDGLPTKDREISASLRDYSGDCGVKGLCDATPSADTTDVLPDTTVTAANYLTLKNGVKVGRKYEPKGSDYLDDVAQALYEMDLRPDLIKPSAGYKNNLVTYAIGFADSALTEDLNNDGTLDNDLNGNGVLDNSILKDAAVRGGGKFYFANNLGELTDSLNNILSDISTKVGSSSSVAANSTKLGTDTAIYQAKFDSSDWTGSFVALPLSSSEDINGNGLLDDGEDVNDNKILDAGIIGDTQWEAAEKIPVFSLRNIFTYNPGHSPKGVLFQCDNLTDGQKTHLGIGNCSNSSDQGVWRLNYLRGDLTHEARNPLRKAADPNPEPRPAGGIFRNRTRFDNATGYALQPDPWLLGDIVNSDPVYVGSEHYGYDKLPGTAPERSSYSSFVNLNKTRQRMVYVGANDGMLHGYDANLISTNSGEEVFAYIPNAVYSQLTALSAPAYVHQYSVDGSPRVSDAYFADSWHTVLAGTTGAGGKAVFALDITDPKGFTGDDVLWEISDTTSPLASDLTTDTPALRGFQNNMGYSLPQPSIVRMNDGSYAAIVANGYAGANNLAVLYVVDLQTGHIIRAFSTETGSSDHPNGLSAPVAVDVDNNRTADAIYAGDLLGNLWKFDVSSTSPNAWTIAYGGSPLFVACSNALSCETTRQPITARPQAGKAEDKKSIMVYFGTGKYFEESDVNVADAQTQSLYGVWDNNAVVARSALQQQSIVAELKVGNFNSRVTTNNTVDYSTKKGWYMDLSVAGSEGERSVSTPLILGKRVIFTTSIPIPPKGTESCSSGSDGVSWIMEMTALTGSRIDSGASGSGGTGTFDLNGDGVIDNNDLVTITIDGVTVAVTVSGILPEYGIFDTPTIVNINKNVAELLINGSNQDNGVGSVKSAYESDGTMPPLGRQSWQQLNIN